MHLIDVIGGRDGPRCGKRATHRASGKGAAQGNKRQTQGLTTQGANGELRDERISASCVGVPACLPGSEWGGGGRAETWHAFCLAGNVEWAVVLRPRVRLRRTLQRRGAD